MSQICTDDRRETPAKDQKSGKPSGAQSWRSSLFGLLFEVSKIVVAKHTKIIAK